MAELADISVGWYSQVELGRASRVSRHTLNSIGRVLRLDPIEMAYLFKLALNEEPAAAPAVPDAVAADTAEHLLRSFSGGPAYVVDRYYNVVAANDAALAILALTPGKDNVLRRLFLEPAARTLFIDWENLAERIVAQARMRYAERVGDPEFELLVAELRDASSDFARLWDQSQIGSAFGQLVRLRPPSSDVIVLRYACFPIPGTAEHVLVLSPAANETSSRRIAELTQRNVLANGDCRKQLACVRSDLGEFLKLRRLRLNVQVIALGSFERLPSKVGRRVTQEEIAEVIGVSRGWYRMLESGSTIRTSPRLLARIGNALMLSAAEQAHLFHLAFPELAAAETSCSLCADRP